MINDKMIKLFKEIHADLFRVWKDYAHNLRMFRGIASVFRTKCGNMNDILRLSVRDVLRLDENGRPLFYLMTKETSLEKPTYCDLWRASKKLIKNDDGELTQAGGA